MSTDDAHIDVTDLSRAFAGQPVIEGVSMRVEPGEIVGLVGANGGGKTTTLRMIGGLLSPTSGSGTVLGRDVTQPMHTNRASIGYMTQSLALYPDLSVAENLSFRARVHSCAGVGVIDDLVRNYGLGAVLSQRVAHLSGGWARRVQFAATVIHRPALLLLDEPTAGLDVVTRRDIWDWLEALARQGCSILISTHDLNEAERCPTIIHYHGGHSHGPMSPAEFAKSAGAQSLEAAVIKQAAA
jgi:ABC-2 type transport system ATP-binding protein